MFEVGGAREGSSVLAAALLHAADESLFATAHLDMSQLDGAELREVIRGLESVRRSLDGAAGHALAALHDRDDTATVGLATSKWLARDANLPPWVARQRLSTALKLRDLLPAVDEALVDGRIGYEHAKVFADAVNERNAATFAVVAPELVEAAGHTSFVRWSRDVKAAADDLDFDGSHDPAGDVLRNKLTLSPSDGFLLLRGELVGDHAVVVEQIIEDTADELHRRYAREREQFPDAQIPCRATLRAFAMVELLRRALGVDEGSSTAPRTEATIVIHADTSPDDPAGPTCTDRSPKPPPDATPDGPVVTAGDGRRLSKGTAAVLVCAGLFQVLVTTVSASGVPIAETDAYRPSRAQRRALAHRDGGCVFPGCTAKLQWCDAHHIRPWPKGPTALGNLILVCRTHHRHIHHLGWSAILTDEGWTRWTSPGGTTRWGQRHGRTRAGPV